MENGPECLESPAVGSGLEVEMKASIVGCGAIAQVHAQALESMSDVCLISAADILPGRARALTGQFGGKAYDSLEALLSAEKPDVLHICTPHFLHVPMTRLAAKQDIAVFTEKPPAINTAQWEDFMALTEKQQIGICFQNRYNQPVKHIKELLKSGRCGKVKGARAFVTWCRDLPYYTESGWRGKLETEGGGALINQAIHTMDLLVYLIGKPLAVEATAANRHLKNEIEVEDTLEAYIEFEGAAALFYATTAYSTDAEVFIELHCEHVILRLEGNTISCCWKNGDREVLECKAPAYRGKAYWGSSHTLCIRDFYESLQSGKHPPIGIPEVRHTMELMLSTYTSAKTEQRITIK